MWLALLHCGLGLTVRAQDSPPPAVFGPRLKLDTPVHDFGKINSGDSVSHAFWFTNAGDSTLIISNVQPSCGCTAAADWTRQVPPGEAGKIPIQFNSANFSGPVTKLVTVISNDTNQPAAYLQIKANVWKPVEVIPNYAVLTVLPDTANASTTVRIINHMEGPLYLGKPEINNTNFTFELRTNMPGKEYQFVIAASDTVRQGSNQALLTVPTSVTNLPPISVNVYASIQPALSILPAQLNLPAGPLLQRLTPVVTIINNTTNKLTLKDPVITPSSLNVQLREVQPGKYFTLAITFPEGFRVPEGVKSELKVSSDNPKYPEIHIPIVPAPAVTAQPQAVAPAATPGTRTPPLVAPRRVVTRPVNPAGAAAQPNPR